MKKLIYTLAAAVGIAAGVSLGYFVVEDMLTQAYKDGYTNGVEASQDLYYDKTCGEICAEPVPDHLK